MCARERQLIPTNSTTDQKETESTWLINNLQTLSIDWQVKHAGRSHYCVMHAQVMATPTADMTAAN